MPLSRLVSEGCARGGGLAMNSKTVVGGGTACKEADLTATHLLTPPCLCSAAQTLGDDSPLNNETLQKHGCPPAEVEKRPNHLKKKTKKTYI